MTLGNRPGHNPCLTSGALAGTVVTPGETGKSGFPKSHTYTHKGNIMFRIKALWARLQERLAEERRARNTINELSKLTDYQLRDMGINRSMISSVARGDYHG